jgi:hypothetical protein
MPSSPELETLPILFVFSFLVLSIYGINRYIALRRNVKLAQEINVSPPLRLEYRLDADSI